VVSLVSLESQLAACVLLVTVRNFLIFEAEGTEVTTGYELLRLQDAAQSEPSCLVLKEQQEDLGKCSNPYRLVTRSVSLWKQWEVQEEGIVAQDVGWRDPGNAPLVGTEPGGKLRGARAWCWLTCVGRSHQEDAYLVQQYGEANGNRKCLCVLTRTGLTLMMQLATSARSVMASSGSAVVSATFSEAVSTPAVRD
jgi:hypothetical protein